MNGSEDWQREFEHEYTRGAAARAAGNEGMARVCARRAAGVVVRAYYLQKGWALSGKNVLNHLRDLAGSDTEPAAVREAAGHFYLRITPEHVLPEDVDLLADARWLKEALFP